MPRGFIEDFISIAVLVRTCRFRTGILATSLAFVAYWIGDFAVEQESLSDASTREVHLLGGDNGHYPLRDSRQDCRQTAVVLIKMGFRRNWLKNIQPLEINS